MRQKPLNTAAAAATAAPATATVICTNTQHISQPYKQLEIASGYPTVNDTDFLLFLFFLSSAQKHNQFKPCASLYKCV